jgi:hypothetical protein
MSVKKETSVIELIINGKQAQTSMNGLTNSIRESERAFRKMREADDPRKYAEAARNINAQKSALNDMKKGISGVNQESEKFNSTWKDIAKGVLAAGFLQAGLGYLKDFGRAVVETYTEFEKYTTVLENSLGSQDAARRAMASLQEFAAKTPFSLSELTESYVKYVNRGIIPTMEQMTKMGDLASSQGKSFDQLTEAVLDAATGEFERLKEFGIRASKNGDVVALSFKGITKEVAFTDVAIQNAVLSFGELEGVVNGMAKQSETLGGKISNLGDSWDQLLVTFGSRTGGVLYNSITIIAEYLDFVTKAFKTTEELIQNNTDNAVGNAVSSLNNRTPEEQKQIIEGTKLYIKSLTEDLLPIQKEIAAKQKEMDALDLDGSVFKRNSLSKELIQLEEKKGKQEQLIAIEKDTLKAYAEGEKQKLDVKSKLDDEKLRLEKNILAKQAEADLKAAQKRAQQEEERSKKEIASIKDNLQKEMDELRLAGMDPLDKILDGINSKFDSFISLAQSKGLNDVVEKLKELRDKNLGNASADFTAEETKKKNDQDLKDNEDALSGLVSLTDSFYQREKNKATQRYADGLIDKQEYETQLAVIEQERIQSLISINQQYGASTLDLEEQLLDAKIALRDKDVEDAKQRAEEKKDFEIEMYQLASDTIFSIMNNNARANSDARLASIQEERAAELNNKELSEKQKKGINDKFDAQVRAEKKRAWAADQRAAAAQALINGALAITMVLRQTGVAAAFVIPTIIATTAAQLAVITAQKAPKFAKGGVLEGPSHANGGMAVIDGTGNKVAELEGGEPILSRETYRNNRETIDALLYSSQRMNGASMQFKNRDSINAERFFRSGGIIGGGSSVTNNSTTNATNYSNNIDTKNLEDKMDQFIAAANNAWNYKTFEEGQNKIFKTRGDATA